jgi:hypothetical protein
MLCAVFPLAVDTMRDLCPSELVMRVWLSY